MKKIVLATLTAGFMALGVVAHAEDAAQYDPSERLGTDNVDYFKQNGVLPAGPTPTVAAPTIPAYNDKPVTADDRMDDRNFNYFKDEAVAKP